MAEDKENVTETQESGNNEQLPPESDKETTAASETDATEGKGTTDSEGKPNESGDSETNEGDKVNEADNNGETEGEAPVDRVVPEAADYKLPDGVPPYVAEFAHENDMTQEQLDATLAQFGGYMTAMDEGVKQKISEEGHKLADSWGDQRDWNLTLVQRALDQNDPEGQLRRVLDDTGYGNHPAVLNFLLSLGQSMKEGGFLKGAVHTPNQRSSTAAKMFGNTHPSNS